MDEKVGPVTRTAGVVPVGAPDTPTVNTPLESTYATEASTGVSDFVIA